MEEQRIEEETHKLDKNLKKANNAANELRF